MALTLYDLVYQLAKKLGIVTVEGAQTGSSSTTVIRDSIWLSQGDDYWNGGTVFALDTGGAAPERQFAIVSDFADTNNELTHGGFSAALAPGGLYAVARATYPLPILISKINSAIRRLGPVEFVDIGGIQIAAETREYAVTLSGSPSPIRKVLDVWMQGKDTSDSDVGTVDFRDYEWERVTEWETWFEEPLNQSNDVGLRLMFPRQLPEGRYLAVRVEGLHPSLSIYSQVVYLPVPVERVVAEAAVECLEWYDFRHKGGDKTVNNLLTLMRQEAAQLAQRYPIRQKGGVQLAQLGEGLGVGDGWGGW